MRPYAARLEQPDFTGIIHLSVTRYCQRRARPSDRAAGHSRDPGLGLAGAEPALADFRYIAPCRNHGKVRKFFD